MNNPLLGSLILAALFFSNMKIGFGCLLGGVVATASEFLFDLHPWELLENGVAPFNGALLGSVVTSLYPILLPEASSEVPLWIAVIVGAVSR